MRPQALMIQALSLSALPRVRHAFFTRNGGVSEGIYASLNGGLGSKDAPDRVHENRNRMAAALGVAPARFLTCHQIHSPNVVVASTPWAREATPEADAIVTREPGLAIGVLTADCGPVLFADGEAGVVGVAHSGWKGALGGVLEATVATMEKLGAERRRIRAALGPLIRKENYEVGPEFVARFSDDDAANEKYFTPSQTAGHAMFDLPAYIAARLARAGVAFEDLKLCTYADPTRFFSYRRTTHRAEPDYGRHVNAIVLNG
jgi:YfiH family protein